MVTYTRTVTNYSFNKPRLMSESEFIEVKKSLPVKPYINVGKELMKEHGTQLLIRGLFFFVPAFTGTFTSAFNYYSMQKKRKKFMEGLFEAIYTSNTYQEYCNKYYELVKKY